MRRRRHVTLEDSYYHHLGKLLRLHVGTRRAYTPLEYVMQKGLHVFRGASPITASFTTLAQLNVYEDAGWLVGLVLCQKGA